MRRRGFSLVEIAVVLVMAALMTGYVLKMKPSASTENCTATTTIQLRDIQGAVGRFVTTNNRLPMPASRILGVDDINYGREALAAALDVTSGITMGALPFQALGLPASFAADCWGNKFTYAVTTTLTTTGGYSPAGNVGAITVKANAANNLTTTAAYVALSHGADGVGAVARNYSGVAKNWCTLSSVLQTENCDVGNATFMSTEINDGKDSGNNKFDDIVVFRGKDVWAIDGVCNNSVALGCTTGTSGSDNGLTSCGTTRTWNCVGSGGGSTSGTCSFANTVCAVNGACDNSVPLGCTAGAVGSDNTQTSCGTTHTWICSGSGGGTDDSCSYANAACPPVINAVCGPVNITWSDNANCTSGTRSNYSAGDMYYGTYTAKQYYYDCLGSGGGSPAYGCESFTDWKWGAPSGIWPPANPY